MSPTLPLLPPDGVSLNAWQRVARADGQRWAITEREASGEVVGTAYRLADGSKTSEPGGRRGLILPDSGNLNPYAGTSESEPLFITEGASDCASLLGLGLDAVGVAMAGGSSDIRMWLAEVCSRRHVVIVVDADEAGRGGARRLAEGIETRCASVRIIEPPGGGKDCRASVIAGVTAEAFRLAVADPECLFVSAKSHSANTITPIDGTPMLVRLEDVQPESVDWLWPGRIAAGKLTLIAGDPGLGKSFLTLDLAARVSRGGVWPDAPGVYIKPGGVVLLSAEDGIADTIRPRLDAAGADVSRIIALEAVRMVGGDGQESARSFDLSRDTPALEDAIRSVDDCRLVVIDPVTAYLGGVDSHKNAEIRGVLSPLGALAEKYGVAIVGVTHLNKSGGGPAIYRAMGSLAFVAAVRTAWSVSKDKDDPDRRLLLPIKNNIAPDTGGLAYRIESTGLGADPVVAWEPDAVEVSADDALASDRIGQGGRTERDDAAEWLTELLANGSLPATDVQREAKDAGFSIATLRRAKAALGVVSRKGDFGGPWRWSLPAIAQDAHADVVLIPENVSALVEGERLGNSDPSRGGSGEQAPAEDGQGAQRKKESIFANGEHLEATPTDTDGWGEL